VAPRVKEVDVVDEVPFKTAHEVTGHVQDRIDGTFNPTNSNRSPDVASAARRPVTDADESRNPLLAKRFTGP